MPWPPRRSSITEVQLQREIEVLGLKLLRPNAALRTPHQLSLPAQYDVTSLREVPEG